MNILNLNNLDAFTDKPKFLYRFLFSRTFRTRMLISFIFKLCAVLIIAIFWVAVWEIRKILGSEGGMFVAAPLIPVYFVILGWKESLFYLSSRITYLDFQTLKHRDARPPLLYLRSFISR